MTAGLTGRGGGAGRDSGARNSGESVSHHGLLGGRRGKDTGVFGLKNLSPWVQCGDKGAGSAVGHHVECGPRRTFKIEVHRGCSGNRR